MIRLAMNMLAELRRMYWEAVTSKADAELVVEAFNRAIDEAASVADAKASEGCGCWCVGKAIRERKV